MQLMVSELTEYTKARTQMPILALLAAAILLLGSSCDDGPTGGGDKTAPTVIATSPIDGATDVSVATSPNLTFSEKLTAGSVSGALSISPGTGSITNIADSIVGVSITGELDYNTTYTVTAATAITDLAGNHLAQEYSFSFTTEVDPNTLPPTLVTTAPTDNATDVPVDQAISAVFSKPMDSVSVAAAFSIDNGVTGTIDVNGATVVFTPDADLDYSTTYTAMISSAAEDTFDIALASPISFSFETQPDPATPVVSILTPEFDAIVGDTFRITASATSSAGIDSVQYLIKGFVIGSATTPPYQLDYSVPGVNIGDGFSVTAKAYANNLGQTLVGTSSEVPLTYLWVYVGQDNPTPPAHINELWYRSSDSVLELRFSYWNNWNPYPYPKDTILMDTMGHTDTITLGDASFGFALYIDADQSGFTGRTYGPPGDTALNGIGADFQIRVGLFGGDPCLVEYNSSTQTFDPVFDTTGLASHVVPPDSNIFVVGIRWSDLENSNALNALAINVDYTGGGDGTYDRFPDIGAGIITILREDRYPGPLESSQFSARNIPVAAFRQADRFDPATANPFD